MIHPFEAYTREAPKVEQRNGLSHGKRRAALQPEYPPFLLAFLSRWPIVGSAYLGGDNMRPSGVACKRHLSYLCCDLSEGHVGL